MRIHTSNLIDRLTVHEAARKAKADIELTEHGSRSHDRAFEVKLTGLSRRRPNSGSGGAGDDYAATWDQWGVFLGALFDVDQTIKAGPYNGWADFERRTDGRFDNLGDSIPFPLDHDHRFKYAGVPREQECVKCGAVVRWY